MKNLRTKAKLLLLSSSAVLVSSTDFAALAATNATKQPSTVYYTIAPYQLAQAEYGGEGTYTRWRSPDGTETGPIAPDANGG
jgi:hypothetical protein